MHPSASILNLHLSLEKFLWDNVASILGVKLIHQDDIATRLEEFKQTNLALIWRSSDLSAENKGELAFFAGAASINDPGGIQRIVLLDKIKEAFDNHAGISVLAYEQTGLITEPETKVNELAIIGPIKGWPAFTDPSTRHTTAYLSQKLKFAQIRN